MTKATIMAFLRNHTVWLAVSLTLLAGSIGYAGMKASATASNNADAIVSSYSGHGNGIRLRHPDAVQYGSAAIISSLTCLAWEASRLHTPKRRPVRHAYP